MEKTIITANIYCDDLERVQNYGKQKGSFFNAWSRVIKMTRDKIVELEWKIDHVPPDLPNLLPSLDNYMRNKQFDNENNLKEEVSRFLKEIFLKSAFLNY